MAMRPEKVALGEAGENSLPGTVRESAYIGVATEFVVDTPAGDITVFHQNAESGGLVPAVGSHVTVTWAAASTFVVDRPNEEGTT
jgi:ABC-type Fe3+/spermidine/putrescine transport system ATPase subunit